VGASVLPAEDPLESASELMHQLDRVHGIDAACVGMFGELQSLRDGMARAPDFALSPDLAFRYTRVAIYLMRALTQFRAATRVRSDWQVDQTAIGLHRIPAVRVDDSAIGQKRSGSATGSS